MNKTDFAYLASIVMLIGVAIALALSYENKTCTDKNPADKKVIYSSFPPRHLPRSIHGNGFANSVLINGQMPAND